MFPKKRKCIVASIILLISMICASIPTYAKDTATAEAGKSFDSRDIPVAENVNAGRPEINPRTGAC